MLIVALNAGSSSLKCALFETSTGEIRFVLRGAVDGIGGPAARLRTSTVHHVDETLELPQATDHRSAFRHLSAAMRSQAETQFAAVGHRVVHGGARFAAPVLIDGSVLAEIKRLVPFAPLHQPCQVRLIEALREEYPAVPQVACFDTAVHRTLPEIAARFPLPRWLWDEGVRRYGFHGLSYEFVLGSNAAFRRGKTIIAHLGHGASITAFQDGVSVETTMGFTPTGGLMMGTRCGDLDPGVFLHLLRRHGCSADDLDRIVNAESGLAGVSGTTSDVKRLLDQSPVNNAAALAVEMFCYQAAMRIGGLAAALNGMDRLVFTGGIGERSAVVRTAICARLSFLGLSLDESWNDTHEADIQSPSSRCSVHVVKTDEELVIARHTSQVLLTAAGNSG
ncbi:MAG: acetate/propionate family kinase [Planctomycetaceae bacterium]